MSSVTPSLLASCENSPFNRSLASSAIKSVISASSGLVSHDPSGRSVGFGLNILTNRGPLRWVWKKRVFPGNPKWADVQSNLCRKMALLSKCRRKIVCGNVLPCRVQYHMARWLQKILRQFSVCEFRKLLLANCVISSCIARIPDACECAPHALSDSCNSL